MQGAAPPNLSAATILLVDDETPNVRALSALLGRAGYTDVVTVTDPRDTPRVFAECRPDLMLLDLRMPHIDGFEVMDLVRPLTRDEDYFPILILTGDTDHDVRSRALAGGATDFLAKPFEQLEVLLRIRNLLETRRLHVHLRKQNSQLEERVNERTRALNDAQTEILFRLALAAEYRDDVTGQHAERVGILAALIAAELDLDAAAVSLIRRAAPLHDVGKIGIPDSILMKPTELNAAEQAVVRSHVDIGAKILSGGSFDLLRMARSIAMSHHERWDGEGYKGMREEEIPLVGRIVAVADVYDVITSDRPYKRAMSKEEAIARIKVDAGHHFDPAVVDAFLRVVASGQIEGLKTFVPPSHYVSEEVLEERRTGEKRREETRAADRVRNGTTPPSRQLRA